jgi:gamma-glutamylaminecyclotransferase
MVRLFVCGTLKRGFALHDRALQSATFKGAYLTSNRYPLLVAGPWYAPMLLNRPGCGHRVRGEVYEIEQARLRAIDELESIGKPGNLRIAFDVEPLAGGPSVSAQAYLKEPNLAVPAHTSWLEEYQQDDPRFVPPWDRPG